MSEKPLYEFTSHVDGKNAKVQIWPDRIEWTRSALSAVKVMTGIGFINGFRNKDTDMIPIKQVTSVTSKKGLGMNTVVHVHTAGGGVEFRVSHSEATKARETLNRLILDA